MTQAIQLTTVQGIAAALDAQKLPAVSVDVITAIGRNCREDFLNRLSLCQSGQDTDGAHLKHLQGMLCCLTGEAQTALIEMELNPPLDDLVKLAARLPARLSSAISAGHDPAHPHHADAKEYLRSVFVPPPAAAPAPPANPAAQAAANSPGEPEDPAPPPAAAEPQQPSRAKYRSAHVYGNGFALCFNAGVDRDQRPGMMVDAAVSVGTRSYDWPNAIHIWLDEREIASALGVFRRWRKSVEFSAHGQANDKSFVLENQGAHFFCKVTATKAQNKPARAVKILPLDANRVSILFLEQLLLAYPNLPPAEVLEQVRLIQQEPPRGAGQQ